jgi:tryptophanyl-tRNA synthetase
MQTDATNARKRILSGVQPSGKLHIGNYFGAIRQHIQLQDEGEAFYFLADFHALTTLNDAEQLRRVTRDAALDYLALGLDPNRATFFRQSDVPEVCELTWLLSTVTSMGLLERAVSYKDKIARGIQPRVGLFTYPVLMAADILIYDSDLVPVGADQAQHIEITRDIAGFFNAAYGETFRREYHRNLRRRQSAEERRDEYRNRLDPGRSVEGS